jgi:thiamine transport system permease protein
VFFFYPLARILWVGLNPAALLAIPTNSLLVIRDTSLFTFYQSILSTLLTLALGLPAAFLFARYDFLGKSFLRTLTAIPFMLPTVVVAAGFTALLGPRGWMNLALMHLFGLVTPPLVFTGTLGAILLAHIFYNTTIVIRIVGNAIAHLDPRLEQAARSLGANPSRVFWRITLALLRPSILAAALLVFIFRFHQFRRYFAAGRAGLFHAGSGDLYTGHVFLQLAIGRAAFAHSTVLHAGFFHPV